MGTAVGVTVAVAIAVGVWVGDGVSVGETAVSVATAEQLNTVTFADYDPDLLTHYTSLPDS